MRFLHSSNAKSSMIVTLLGMVIEVKFVQNAKVPSQMTSMLSGIVSDVRPVQPLECVIINTSNSLLNGDRCKAFAS